MTAITLAISITALLFAISGFVLGLLGFIQAKASAASTHTVQYQEAPNQVDLSEMFGSPSDDHPNQGPVAFEIPNDELEEKLLKGLD
jgi:hypothetical protein